MSRTSTTLQAGAKIALQHGARSPRVYSPLAEALIEATLEQRPDLCRYPDLVSSWADNEAKAALVRVWLEEHGLFGQGTRPRAAINVLKLFDGAAARDRRELGLTPMSEITLTKLRAETVAAADLVSIEELRDIGRKTRSQ